MKRLISSFLVFVFLLSASPAVLAEEKEGFKVTFVADEHATVDVYDTQDYTAPSGENVDFAYARDSESGQIDISGDGQVNFKVKAEDGYEIASVIADKNYKNLKDPAETKAEGIYRLTKIAGDVTVTITTASTDPGEPAEPSYTPVAADSTRVKGYYNQNAALKLELAGRYNSGAMSADGGSLEIVQYNAVNGFAYAVSGIKGKLIAIDLNGSLSGELVVDLPGEEYDVKSLVEGFAYGDMTSVAVSPDGTKLAVAIQAEDYAEKGVVALFACHEDGSLELLSTAEVGVQPDMLTFADERTILTADEGEPREGTEGTDPQGSVSIVTIAEDNTLTAQTVCFTDFDEKRDELTAAGVLMQKDTAPSVDFEPEYIAVSNGIAYISLQEANAVAVLDIASAQFTAVYPLGFQDYGETMVDLEKNDTIELKNFANVYGIKMPDGISVTAVGGKTYLLTANEGDSRADWEGLDNELESKTSLTGNVKADGKVVWFNAEMWDGLDEEKDYVFGGRSFSIYEITANGLDLVYDSGSDFEMLTAELLPEYFNASNDKISMDNRSGKKGPEPESVVTGTLKGRTYAFVALERIGGVMVYDITVPQNARFVNYINSREFTDPIQGDVSPEGLCFVSPADSKNGKAMLLAACEVSGTLAVYQLTPKSSSSIVTAEPAQPAAPTEPQNPVEPQKPVTPSDPAQIASAEKIVLTIGQTEAIVYGENVANDVAPIIRNSRTMLPIRFIAEALGANVAWDESTSKVTIAKDSEIIEIFIGRDYALVNGQSVTLDAPAFIENGRTYLPLRFVAENLGASVYWNEAGGEVTIVPEK